MNRQVLNPLQLPERAVKAHLFHAPRTGGKGGGIIDRVTFHTVRVGSLRSQSDSLIGLILYIHRDCRTEICVIVLLGKHYFYLVCIRRHSTDRVQIYSLRLVLRHKGNGVRCVVRDRELVLRQGERHLYLPDDAAGQGECPLIDAQEVLPGPACGNSQAESVVRAVILTVLLIQFNQVQLIHKSVDNTVRHAQAQVLLPVILNVQTYHGVRIGVRRVRSPAGGGDGDAVPVKQDAALHAVSAFSVAG